MATIKDYAQLALFVYRVDPKNEINEPNGWAGDKYIDDPTSGFSYGIFESGNEVVISYTGTNEGVDWLANAGSGSGLGSDQLKEAALVAARVIEQYKGSGKTISFTGHSLGGGLASVMAVWFDKQAIVFDEAPFLSAAITGFRGQTTIFIVQTQGAARSAICASCSAYMAWKRGDASEPGMNPAGSDEMRVNSRGRKIGAVRM